ncbi:hypothetical protein HWV07_06815 [Natronomonas salina]|uniref:hypothetical protein n=1 Tax=Natronomonas salina TaxID=1710540 RepID=UPI0015B56F77|nr:hypothetical protein [Natronomonas salina]QLD88761.1 hypothetical protein HWV07_06815 [Natronomonas salina]
MTGGWDSSSRQQTTPGSFQGRQRIRDDEWWWSANSYLRFYGMVFLIGTKTADAITTAVGLRYVPSIVERNPFADAVFADSGTLAGLAFLSFLTVIITVLTTEWLALIIHRRLRMDRLALLSKAFIYGSLSLLFGVIAINNSLLISQQIQVYFADLLTLTV